MIFAAYHYLWNSREMGERRGEQPHSMVVKLRIWGVIVGPGVKEGEIATIN